MRLADVSSFKKPVLASKVESISKNKGKEVIQESMKTSDEEISDSMETEDEIPFQFDTLPPSNFSLNMAFTLPTTFSVKEGQSLTIKGDIEEGDASSASMVVEENGSKEPSNVETKLEEYLIEHVKSETNNIGGLEDGSRIIILRLKKSRRWDCQASESRFGKTIHKNVSTFKAVIY